MAKHGFLKYLGVVAFGIKMGVILAGDNIVQIVYEAVKKCCDDNLIDDNDIICVKENVVARSQNNFVTLDQISKEI